MKFAVILREAGFVSKEFPKCSEIPIILYDRKDRIIEEDDIHFVETLFKENNNSFMNFYDFLKSLEKSNEPIDSINVMIDEYNVIVFYKSSKLKFFPRTKKSLDPIDYMD